MAKKQRSKQQQETRKPMESVTEPQGQSPRSGIQNLGFKVPESLSVLYEFKVQAIIIGIVAFVFYFNSFFNEYAHDDGIVIVKNEYVQEGFAGIPKILTRDAYDSYYRQLNTTNQLSGGRYRPLSIVTFAIEQQFFGAVSEENVDSILRQNISFGVRGKQQARLIQQMHIRHIFNVLWYMLSVIVLLYFLRYIVFRGAPIMAFVAALIFTIHPIHTEVVANVKSRDEIMSLLFMCMTFILDFKYREQKKPWLLICALISYFLAFLSKEYAITMVVLLPLALYIFNGYSIKKSLIAFVPYLAIIAAYMALRLSIVAPMGENSDTEVLNNPYVFASFPEKLATEIATSLNYLRLLIFPHPLSADYSYDSIPYKDFMSPWVWLSLLVHGGLVVVMFTEFKKRSVLCFAIAFYLLHLALVCNIFFDIGATMGERLIYHSSVGFAIAAAYFIIRAVEKVRPGAVAQRSLAVFILIIVVLSGFKTIQRNAEWKNDNVLFAADVKTVPNSVLVLGNVAASNITLADEKKTEKEKNECLYKAIELLNHAILIHPKFVAGFLNRGIAWYKLGDMVKAKANLDSARALYPNYPTLPGIYKIIGNDYMKKGWDNYGRIGKYPEAIIEFKKGIAIDSNNAELWYNLGGAYYSNRQYPEAVEAWRISLKLDPTNVKAQQGMQAGMGALQMMNQQHKN